MLDVLHWKHLGIQPPTAERFEVIGGSPTAFIPAEITDEAVASIVQQLLGEAGPGGSDLVSLQHWLLWFEAAGSELSQIVGEFGYWMANGRPPWAVYRALMLGCLTGLDKSPGVHPVRVGKTWRRMLEKCVLAVMGADSKEACVTYQLCRGLEDGIEGGIHAVHLLW